MPSEGPRIPPAGSGAGAIGQTRPRDQGPRPSASVSRGLIRRYFVDPHDIEAAIERLTQLLAADTDGPRMDVPPGFYLNILV
jgi:hypothetical protein